MPALWCAASSARLRTQPRGHPFDRTQTVERSATLKPVGGKCQLRSDTSASAPPQKDIGVWRRQRETHRRQSRSSCLLLRERVGSSLPREGTLHKFWSAIFRPKLSVLLLTTLPYPVSRYSRRPRYRHPRRTVIQRIVRRK